MHWYCGAHIIVRFLPSRGFSYCSLFCDHGLGFREMGKYQNSIVIVSIIVNNTIPIMVEVHKSQNNRPVKCLTIKSRLVVSWPDPYPNPNMLTINHRLVNGWPDPYPNPKMLTINRRLVNGWPDPYPNPEILTINHRLVNGWPDPYPNPNANPNPVPELLTINRRLQQF